MPRAVLYVTLRALGPMMPAQFTPTECPSIDSNRARQATKAASALAETSRACMRRGVELILHSAVPCHGVGLTHWRDTEEARERSYATKRAQIRSAAAGGCEACPGPGRNSAI